MSRIRVGVLNGGPSSEFTVSLKTGQAVLTSLPDKYQGINIFIDKKGVWHKDGIEVKPEDVFKNIDVVFNALHGEYGEDGKVQQLMDQFGVKYTGSGALSSAIGINKTLAKSILKTNNIKVPIHILLKNDHSPVSDMAQKVFRSLPMPVIIKPADRGSSIGLSKAWNIPDIQSALEIAFSISETVLVEEFIRGREATCGVIEDFRDQKMYSLLPTEILIKDKDRLYDFDHKDNGGALEICPANFGKEDKEEIQKIAIKVHTLLGLKHYSRSDFILTNKRGVYFLEVNTLPALSQNSLFQNSLKAVGSNLGIFLDHVLQLALNSK